MCYTFTFLPLNPNLFQTSIVVRLPIPTFIDDVLGFTTTQIFLEAGVFDYPRRAMHRLRQKVMVNTRTTEAVVCLPQLINKKTKNLARPSMEPDEPIDEAFQAQPSASARWIHVHRHRRCYSG